MSLDDVPVWGKSDVGRDAETEEGMEFRWSCGLGWECEFLSLSLSLSLRERRSRRCRW